MSRIYNSTITLMAESKLSYKEDANKAIETAQGEVTDLKNLVAEQTASLETLGKNKVEQDQRIAGLQDQAESTATLKEA